MEILHLDFTVNTQGEPVYQLFYKGKAVVKPSKLGLELKDAPGLMSNFTLTGTETSTFDETWKPCGEKLRRFVITIMNWL